MNKIASIEELQKIELDILVSVVDYFEKNNISYFLAGGSMLGAVRHNGFIPWDDDIDVLVPRTDYDKLLSSMMTSSICNGEFVVKKPGMENYPYPYIKVVDKRTRVNDRNIVKQFNNMGVWIDVFPLDHFPDNTIMHRVCLIRLKFWRWAINTHMKPQGLETGGVLANMIFRLIYKIGGGYQKISVKIDSIARKMNNKYISSHHYGDGAWPAGINDYFDEEWVKPLFKHKFEGYEFNIPVNYDGYLTHFYGDYMTPPPVEKRRYHDIDAYYL